MFCVCKSYQNLHQDGFCRLMVHSQVNQEQLRLHALDFVGCHSLSELYDARFRATRQQTVDHETKQDRLQQNN